VWGVVKEEERSDGNMREKGRKIEDAGKF